MSNITPKFSNKYLDFLAYGMYDGNDVTWENLEGTTAAGKTTVGMIKFMLKVAELDEDLHIIAGANLGVIQKNIVKPSLGIVDIFGELVEERANGSSKHAMPHLIYHTSKGDKIIYLLGYEDRARWKKVLGGQYGAVYIDEVNTADMDFVREIGIRNKYMMTTMNPDDPKLPVYSEYINRSRPLPKYARDVPKEIMNELEQERPEPGWVYWFFDFYDNAGLTDKRRYQIMNSAAKGTKLYKNKIQGIRGRAEGLIFPSFTKNSNIITRQEADRRKYTQYTAGVDTSYSQKSDDTIAFIFAGLSTKGEYVVLDEYTMNNRDLNEPLAPSDVAVKLVDFLEKNRARYGFSRYVHVDNADQSTITELNKLKKRKRLSYKFINSDKSVSIIDRINSMNGWIGGSQQTDDVHYKVVDECKAHITELEIYAWNGDKPEDRNDHTINASQYAWIPHRSRIGVAMKQTPSEAKRRLKAQLSHLL